MTTLASSPSSAGSLADRVPPRTGAPPEELLDLFLGYARALGLTLYPAQEQAILELATGSNVILATPTGSGKSLVALAMHFFALAQGKRSFYTAPIKALVSEKFFALCRDFGADNVGLVTGDASVNRDAPIVCCTAEILSNMALREGKRADVDCVVSDEFHYYADRERGVAWQIPLLVLERTQFLLMSATLGPTEFFERALTKLNRLPTVTVRSSERPVPLEFEYRETPLHETIADLVQKGRAPVYVVNFTQRAAAETAQALLSVDFIPKEQKRTIAAELASVRFDTPYGKEMKRFLAHGVGVHHAGLLPKYRLLVEKLAQRGLLAIISGTDTLGVGVNVPIRTVLFTRLCKFDGEKTAILTVREFQQIAGRAGRRGFDDRGFVAVQAPEHVIENLRLEQKAGDDPVKKKRIVRKKPPEKGYLHWDRSVFDRLVGGQAEALVSRFRVSHGMVLNVLERDSRSEASPELDRNETGARGCRELARLIHRAHERRAQRRIFGREAASMFESLKEAGIIEVDPETARVRVHVDLQEDFSIHHALSLWLLDTLPRVDRESPTYALDVLTLVESILESPEFVLRQQLDALKTEKLAELKMAGVEYEERMAELEKLEHPKPLREFVYGTFNEFARIHPWVRGDDVRPKSIAREMVERFMDFNEYVREYELGRAEGTLLRYLSDVYKAVVQTVPAPAKTPEVEEVEVFLRAMVRAVDSSLLDEWERMRAPEGLAARGAPAAPEEVPGEVDVTQDERGFTVLVRNAMYQVLRAVSRRDWSTAASLMQDCKAETLEHAFAPFYAEHSAIRLDPKARSPQATRIEKESGVWQVVQVVSDAEGDDDWALRCTIDLDASARAARPIITFHGAGTT
jgi:superfamily II RNA helicase